VVEPAYPKSPALTPLLESAGQRTDGCGCAPPGPDEARTRAAQPDPLHFDQGSTVAVR
jgi:hypothetical protein